MQRIVVESLRTQDISQLAELLATAGYPPDGATLSAAEELGRRLAAAGTSLEDVTRQCTARAAEVFSGDPARVVGSGALYTAAVRGWESVRAVTDDEAATAAASRARLEIVLQGANLGFIDQKLGPGELIMNDRWLEMLGYTRAEFESVADNWEVQLHPDDIERVRRMMDTVIAGKLLEYESEHRVRTRSGEYRWVLARGRVVERRPDGRALRIAGTRLDITDRKQAEEALRRSEENYRLLVENQAELVVKMDRAGQLVYVSPSYCRTFGRTEAKLLEEGYVPLIHEDDLATALACLETAARPPYEAYFEERARTVQGWRWQAWLARAIRDERGEVTGFIGVARDIHEQKLAQAELHRYRDSLEDLVAHRARELADANTRLRAELEERKRTEDRLRASEEMFRMLAATLPVLVFIIEGDHAVYANPATLKLLGYEEEEFLRLPIIEHVHPEVRQGVADRINSWREGPEIIDRYEVPLVTRSGEERWVDFSAAPIDHHGTPALLGTALDITERRRADAEVRQQQERLAHVARISTVGEMASGLAHELAQPLSAVLYYARGGLKRLDSGTWTAADTRTAFERIAQQAERAGQFVRSLKSFVRKTRPNLQATALRPVIEEALGFAALAARVDGVKFDLDVPHNLTRVRIDRTQVAQVVLNLVQNAIDAMRGSPPETRRLQIRAAECDGGIEVRVRDHGTGLDAAVEAQIFEPFFTTRPTGTGLGLSISRRIVEEIHGGRIWAQNEPDGGATFGFLLPRATEELDDIG